MQDEGVQGRVVADGIAEQDQGGDAGQQEDPAERGQRHCVDQRPPHGAAADGRGPRLVGDADALRRRSGPDLPVRNRAGHARAGLDHGTRADVGPGHQDAPAADPRPAPDVDRADVQGPGLEPPAREVGLGVDGAVRPERRPSGDRDGRAQVDVAARRGSRSRGRTARPTGCRPATGSRRPRPAARTPSAAGARGRPAGGSPAGSRAGAVAPRASPRAGCRERSTAAGSRRAKIHHDTGEASGWANSRLDDVVQERQAERPAQAGHGLRRREHHELRERGPELHLRDLERFVGHRPRRCGRVEVRREREQGRTLVDVGDGDRGMTLAQHRHELRRREAVAAEGEEVGVLARWAPRGCRSTAGPATRPCPEGPRQARHRRRPRRPARAAARAAPCGRPCRRSGSGSCRRPPAPGRVPPAAARRASPGLRRGRGRRPRPPGSRRGSRRRRSSSSPRPRRRSPGAGPAVRRRSHPARCGVRPA